MPLEHLETGRQIVVDNGFVAFGSRRWERFREIDEMRGGDPVPALLYPSWEDKPGPPGLTVAWFGWYIGHVEARLGGHPDGMKYRPPSTAKFRADNLGHWAVFWHVSGLRELPAAKQVSIGKLKTVSGGWRNQAPPRGPELVQLPELLSYET